MHPFSFIFLSFLLLVPIYHFQNCGPQGVLCDYAPCVNCLKKTDDGENCMPTSYYKNKHDDAYQEQLSVKVRCEPTKEETTTRHSLAVTEKQETTRQEDTLGDFEPSKDMRSKYYSQKTSASEKLTPKPVNKIVKLEFAKADFTCPKRKNVMNAECEQCELQVKANGDGVMLRCRDCREVPSSEIAFPQGSNRKVIRLP